MRIGLRVYGTPIPQGSKTPTKGKGGRPGLRDANGEKLKPWRDDLATRARNLASAHDECPFAGPVAVWLRFTFERPKTHYRTGRNRHILRDGAPVYPGRVGDVDKLIRAVFDALTEGGIWADDSQVVDIRRARKFYAGEHELALGQAGVEVVIEPL